MVTNLKGSDLKLLVSKISGEDFILLPIDLRNFLGMFGRYSNVSMDSKVFQVSLLSP